MIIITIVRLPAAVVLGFWFVLQALSGILHADAGGGVAFRAHIGGFLAGMALVHVFRRPDFRPIQPY
jgi:membrane associated rhomboid family serine protease